MATELVKELIDAGVHFGHRVSRWNPKMKPYIFGKRNLIHIIDVKETLRGILLGRKFLSQVAAKGLDVLFVGTKRQARKAVEENAQRIEMHWVNDRWLGGTLTNFREIRKRVGRLDELEALDAEGKLDQYSKKEGASLRREMRKIRRNLGGLRRMTRLPGALVIIDQRRELIAVREARKLGIPVVCLLDTDSNPDVIDIPIPGNDDAMRAIELVISNLASAVGEGVQARGKAEADTAEATQQRRSRRPTTARASDETQTAPPPGQAQSEPVAETPAASPAEVPAKAPPEAPAEAPAKAPAEVPAEAPAEAPAKAPAEVPAEAPAEAKPAEGEPA